MKTYLKYLFLVLFLIGNTNKISAQYGKQKKADALFNSFSFVKAIEVYKEILNNNYNIDYTKRKLADAYAMLKDSENAAVYYKDVVKNDKIDPEYYLRYGLALRSMKKYEESEIWLKKYEQSGKVDSRIKKIMEDKNFLTNIYNIKQQYFIKEVPFNTELSDFGAIQNNNNIIFASTRDKGVGIKRTYSWNQQPFLDLYQTAKDGDKYGEPQKIKGDVNTKYHEGQISMSKNGKTLYFTRNNYNNNKKGKDGNGTNNLKIYKATIDKYLKWINIVELPFNSDDYSAGHPSLSADEKTLYFASDMPGGYGKSDIYKVSIEGENYGKPENLGNKINTEGNEMFPFVHNDGNLFFSSDGLPGIGQLDIFTTVLDDKNNIQEIINLGVPINSNLDDFSFFLNENGENGYISSNRTGGKGDDDIYSFDRILPFAIKGTVTDAVNNKPIPNSKIVVTDKNGAPVLDLLTDSKGEYSFSADRETIYNIKASNDKYQEAQSKIGDTRNSKGKSFIIVDFELNPIQDVDVLAGVNIDNVYFDFNKSNIRNDAAIELNKIADLMLKTYPTMAVEIESHTDSRGRNEYNYALSVRRAKSTFDYLVSQGVNPIRIKKVEGYGEFNLVNDCKDGISCAEEAHQLNRRTIFKILKME
jgi:outer membrane protein OmpA-like peptidoglycan-associated protein